ncbi:carboxypeptidase-like regulatory domain-containing protein [[Flexibacter] sp. ATCC 35208]|uniref:carboxypeptidase-like regulatory domain-containing protein n=1 Tax=[Flexibacter] sp. ATCC 35208 TaxID=1936242 RepID=UPI0009FA4E8F|nr:carboxypeptidase-like regulatory domain-containing protein [[Flexibacter] sp. ATCC 35208]
MKKYIVSIPEPCTVPLQDMTPMPGGKYCSSCQKQVVDFSGMTNQQMITYFEKHPNCCGSFLPSQLDKEIIIKPGRTWMPAALIAGMLALVIPESGKGQYKLTGIVHDSTSHDPLASVTVIVMDRQGKTTNTGTTTNADGTFSLLIPEEYETGLKVQLRYVGYEIKKVTVPEKQLKANEPTRWVLDMSAAVLGMPAIVYVKSSRWKRFMHKIFR